MSTSPAAAVRVQLGDRSYSIYVGSRVLASPTSYRDLPRGSGAVIVTNPTVRALYAASLATALTTIYPKLDVIELPDGEAFKTLETLQVIFDGLVRAQADRGTIVFALGGGVIGDLAGFAAACYMRGVGYVQVPTTLLAQVDSSVGGKTGINHPSGKNLIGAFHQPLAVIADVDALATLPRRELVAGLAEVIKYGAIADDAFLSSIEASLPALLAGDSRALTGAVMRSCQIKASVVEADERESGLRAILNFGHTFAHAIRDRDRPRHVATWRSCRLWHGDGGRSVGPARPDRARARRTDRFADRRRWPAVACTKPRCRALSRADADGQEGRGRSPALRRTRGCRAGSGANCRLVHSCHDGRGLRRWSGGVPCFVRLCDKGRRSPSDPTRSSAEPARVRTGFLHFVACQRYA